MIRKWSYIYDCQSHIYDPHIYESYIYDRSENNHIYIYDPSHIYDKKVGIIYISDHIYIYDLKSP